LQFGRRGHHWGALCQRSAATGKEGEGEKKAFHSFASIEFGCCTPSREHGAFTGGVAIGRTPIFSIKRE
jgi:hypothetical protein